MTFESADSRSPKSMMRTTRTSSGAFVLRTWRRSSPLKGRRSRPLRNTASYVSADCGTTSLCGVITGTSTGGSAWGLKCPMKSQDLWSTSRTLGLLAISWSRNQVRIGARRGPDLSSVFWGRNTRVGLMNRKSGARHATGGRRGYGNVLREFQPTAWAQRSDRRSEIRSRPEVA